MCSSELASWTYQHSTSIDSTRSFSGNITVNEFALVSSILQEKMVFVMILTNNHWIEVYSTKTLHQEPHFTLHLRAPARIHPTSHRNFYILTNKGCVSSIMQQITDEQQIKFNQTDEIQLKIQCSKMFSSVLSLHGLESLVVLADNGSSMAIWNMEHVIYIDVNVSSYGSLSQLKSMISEPTEKYLLLHFNHKTLLSGEVNIDQQHSKGSVQFTSFDQVDKYCSKKQSLAIYRNNGRMQLNLHDTHASTSLEPIQLESECQELCFNESATYVFVLLKSRVLFMYRMKDHRQLAKLYTSDLVTFITADNDFVVLAMNDRRLLTLMIADPDDPTLSARIQALPSRYVSCK